MLTIFFWRISLRNSTSEDERFHPVKEHRATRCVFLFVSEFWAGGQDTIPRTAHISRVEFKRTLVCTPTLIFTHRRILSIKLLWSWKKSKPEHASDCSHALPRQSDGHVTTQGSYSRSDPPEAQLHRGTSGFARSTPTYQAELHPSTGYEPNLYYEDKSSNFYVSISGDTVQSAATSSWTEDAPTTLLVESLLWSSHAGRELQRYLVSKWWLPTYEINNVLRRRRIEGKSANVIVVRVLKHFTTKNDSLKRPLLVIDGKPRDFTKRDSKRCHADNLQTWTQRWSWVWQGTTNLPSWNLSRFSASTRSATWSPDLRSSRRISSKRHGTSGYGANSRIWVAFWSRRSTRRSWTNTE